MNICLINIYYVQSTEQNRVFLGMKDITLEKDLVSDLYRLEGETRYMIVLRVLASSWIHNSNEQMTGVSNTMTAI
jgi:hypothetical protein